MGNVTFYNLYFGFALPEAGWLLRNVGLVHAPFVVEGELVVIRHPPRGEFRAVVELQVREARRGR